MLDFAEAFKLILLCRIHITYYGMMVSNKKLLYSLVLNSVQKIEFFIGSQTLDYEGGVNLPLYSVENVALSNLNHRFHIYQLLFYGRNCAA